MAAVDDIPTTAATAAVVLRRSVAVAAGLAVATSATLAAEVLWVAKRRLPSFTDLDASGLLPGPDEVEPLRLVTLGDSTLTGPGLGQPEAVWLRQALARLDRDRPVEVVSLARGGSRAADVAVRIAEAVDQQPDLVVLAVGANDAFHATPTRRFAALLDDALGRLLADVPVVAVTNLGDLANVARIPTTLKPALRRRSRAICRAIEAMVARHEGAVLLDVTASDDAFRDRSVFGADLFHPNERGHAIWADAAVPGLQQALDRVAARQR